MLNQFTALNYFTLRIITIFFTIQPLLVQPSNVLETIVIVLKPEKLKNDDDGWTMKAEIFFHVLFRSFFSSISMASRRDDLSHRSSKLAVI